MVGCIGHTNRPRLGVGRGVAFWMRKFEEGGPGPFGPLRQVFIVWRSGKSWVWRSRGRYPLRPNRSRVLSTGSGGKGGMREDRRILLVEDDPDSSTSLQQLLEGDFEGVRVLVADNAERALKILEESPVDLIIADYKLPGPSGVDFLKQVERRGVSVPRILVTAYLTTQLAQDVVNELRLDGFFVKPFQVEQLEARVRSLLSPFPEGSGRISPSRPAV